MGNADKVTAVGSTGEDEELGLILVPCSHAGYPAGLTLSCYIDRWREGRFPRGYSVKSGY